MLQAECVKDHGVHVNRKLRFHHHIDFLFPYAMKLLTASVV
jgi:hypothetical protein